MTEGTIVGLTDKGFGFIQVGGEEKDIFFHARELVNTNFDDLQKGDKVTLEIGQDEKGKHATNVSKI